MSYLKQVEIERLGADRYRLWLPFAEERQVEVRSSVSYDALVAPHSVIQATDSLLEIEGLPPAARHYFHFRIDGVESGVVAHRHIPLEGTPNFRDFGGYPTPDGRYVRWGQLYRSGVLSQLTAADAQHFQQLNIEVICDFRSEEERRREPTQLPKLESLQVELLPLLGGNQAGMLMTMLRNPSQEINVRHTIEAMLEINRDFALTQIPTYSRLLQLAVNAKKPMLIHCSAGKDRTGFGAAILLAALGVSESVIMQDYLLTQKYFLIEKEAEHLLSRYQLAVKPEVMVPVLEARPVYLQAAFDSIRTEFGDMATYLREGLGFNAAAQRELSTRLLVGTEIKH